jgi:phosphotransferase system IIA component
MNGDGFTTTLKVGDKVSVGDLLVKVDLEKVKNAGYEATTPIVITNMEKVKILEKTESRNVTKGEKLVSYKCA